MRVNHFTRCNLHGN